MRTEKVSQGDLQRIVKEKGAVRAGSSTNLEGRIQQYKQEGYKGKLFHADTRNMMKAEDKLLKENPLHNQQKLSNAPERPGKVYVIKGGKFKDK